MTETASRPFDVYFGSELAARKPIPPRSVLITPGTAKWDDFGHNTRVAYRIRIDDSPAEHQTQGLVGFLGLEAKARNGADHLRKIVSGESDELLPADRSLRFFTMLPSIDAYREVVGNVGAQAAETLLVALYDVVAGIEFTSSADWIDEAVRSDVFALSFVRDSEAYFAFKNAGPVLRGLDFEELGRLSQELKISFKLAGRENEHVLHFKFDHHGVLPKRMAVIIGKNGVGKSQTLGRIARAALRGDTSLIDAQTGDRPLISRLLAFAPTNEAESVFPQRRRGSRVWYQRYSLNRSRRSRQNEYVSDQVVQLARSRQRIKDNSRWRIFLEAIKAIESPDELALPMIGSESEYLELRWLREGTEKQQLEKCRSVDVRKEPVRLIGRMGYPLSSGEISFLKFASQVSLHIENGALILLDEPETHLHPNFVSRFVSLLDELLALTGSAAVIATHSAYFVREVFREQVTILRNDGALIEAEIPMLRTFGADVGAISYFVFGEDSPSKLAEEVQSRLVSSGLPWETLYETYREEFSLEFLNGLRARLEEKQGTP